MEIINIIIGLAVGCIIGYLIAKNKSNEILASRDVEKAKAEGLMHQLDEAKKQHNAQISELKSQFDRQIAGIMDQNAFQVNELKEQHSMQIEQLKQQHKIQQDQQMALLKEQINTTSEKILKERSE